MLNPTSVSIWLVRYRHKHGDDVSVYDSLEAAKYSAEEIRKEWHPKAKSYKEIIDFSGGDESVEIAKETVHSLGGS